MRPLFAVLSLVLCFEFQKLFLSTKRKYSLVSLLNNKLYLKQSISFLLSKEIQLALFSATLYAMWPLQCNSLGEFHLILQTEKTLPESRLLLQIIYIFIDLPVHSLSKLTS